MDLALGGRTAVITGGNAGIGRAIGRVLAHEGVRVLLTGRNPLTLAQARRAIVDVGGHAHIFEADHLDPGASDAIAGAARDALDGADILVNNAGGSRPFGKDATEEQWREAMTLNFERPRQIAMALLPNMQSRGWGRIVNITGKSEPENVNGAFCAKAAIHSWSKGLSREVGSDGVTVNCVAPGRIMSDQIRRNYSPNTAPSNPRPRSPWGAMASQKSSPTWSPSFARPAPLT